jgi:hypothetical protein
MRAEKRASRRALPAQLDQDRLATVYDPSLLLDVTCTNRQHGVSFAKVRYLVKPGKADPAAPRRWSCVITDVSPHPVYDPVYESPFGPRIRAMTSGYYRTSSPVTALPMIMR